MTVIIPPLKKQEPEEQTIFLTTPLINNKKNYRATSSRIIKSTRSLAQISVEPGTYEGNKYYGNYLPKQVEIGSSTYDSLPKTNIKERRSKFFSLPINDLSNNLPRIHKKIEAKNYQRQRAQRLRLYLDSLKSEVKEEIDAGFTEGVLNLSWFVWEALKRFFEETGLCLEVPDACPGLRDNFMYTWSKSEHYLECEIFGSGEIEFFYRNRNTGEVWGEDTTLEQGFSANILNKGSFFSE
ncbi:hypothetical protein [Microcoleus sp. POL10_C6]|uniref:hypothetical protein n=1 Tax=unclassified Microcoleus TaxID=2642155 RepID=UPI002FCFA2DF